MKNKVLIFTFALMAGFFFTTSAFGQESVESSTVNQVELTVTGMTCGGCASKQQSFLEGLKGVTVAKVDYSANKATVSFDADKTNKENILASLNDSPFPAKATATAEAKHSSCTGKSSKKSCDPSDCHKKKSKKTEL